MTPLNQQQTIGALIAIARAARAVVATDRATGAALTEVSSDALDNLDTHLAALDVPAGESDPIDLAGARLSTYAQPVPPAFDLGSYCNSLHQLISAADSQLDDIQDGTFNPNKALPIGNLSTHVGACANAVAAASHFAALTSGWWKDTETGQDVRSWPKKHLDLWISAKLMLIVTEVAEAMEGHRKGLMDDKLPHRTMLEVELADTMIRIGDLAGGLKLDLGGAVAEKMAYNAQRADHKIENRLAAGGKSI